MGEASMRELYDRGQIEIQNLLANARRQADERRFDEFLIVDVDSHHYEDVRWDEIIPYVEDDQIRDWAKTILQRPGKGGAATITTAQLGNQEISGRVLRSGRNHAAGQHDLGAEQRRHDDVARMIWAMDMMGIDYTIMFPTPMLHLSLHPAPEVEVALARAYTKWFTSELLPQDDRIKTLVYLPFNDPAASLRFVEEFADTPGVAGFMVTSIRYRGVHSNEYAPVYSFCNIIHLTNMLVNAIPERFPRLKLMWIESGLAWVPFLMQRLDNEYLMRTSECPGLKRLPSGYMREMYFSTQPMERTASPQMMAASFEMMDAQNTLLYSSDYPHWDFDVPSVIYDLPFLSEQARRNILGENARKLFGIPEGKRAPKSAADAGLGFGGAEPILPALS
jgi:predicted TIM-barrel fold metal-dependent hydrolase